MQVAPFSFVFKFLNFFFWFLGERGKNRELRSNLILGQATTWTKKGCFDNVLSLMFLLWSGIELCWFALIYDPSTKSVFVWF